MVPGNVSEEKPAAVTEAERRANLSDTDFLAEWAEQALPQFMPVYIPKWKPPNEPRPQA